MVESATTCRHCGTVVRIDHDHGIEWCPHCDHVCHLHEQRRPGCQMRRDMLARPGHMPR